MGLQGIKNIYIDLFEVRFQGCDTVFDYSRRHISTVDLVTTNGEVVTTTEDVKVTTATVTPQISKDDVTLAQTLIEIKAANDKGKGIIIKPKKPLKKKYQIVFDEEVTRKLDAQMKAKMKEEERIAREKDEANIALIEEWDDVQATIDQKDFKGKRFDAIKKMFDKVYKRVNNFMDINTDIVEEKLKKNQAEVTEGSFERARDEIEQENAKRRRLEKEDDTTELKICLEIIPEDDDDETIEATPLSSKSPTIVDYKIYKERKKATLKSSGQMETHKTI
uniref:Uncharacterized protein n=1 Tax=Tanacetum cinerariifolium TaxID=118510 RepID=A0A6L2KCR3_TANCI|nr:hypothetical protein [Tanacetum cinerariifolium]